MSSDDHFTFGNFAEESDQFKTIADDIENFLDDALATKNLLVEKVDLEKVLQQQHEHLKIYHKLRNIPATKTGLFRLVCSLREQLSNQNEKNSNEINIKNRKISELTSENEDLVSAYKNLENVVEEWQHRAVTAEERLEQIKSSSTNEVSRINEELIAVKKHKREVEKDLKDRIKKITDEQDKKLKEIYRERAEILCTLEEEKNRYISSRLELLERDYGLT